MDDRRSPGFLREDLENRYDVAQISEDEWHTHSGRKTDLFVQRALPALGAGQGLLLNAGCGVYKTSHAGWHEISLDLFAKPLAGKANAVCARVEALPFRPEVFSAAVCVGEVLAYCDPAACIRELARVLRPEGNLILDFGSTRSVRRLLGGGFGRAADVIVDDYNGSPERTWIYDPAYIKELLNKAGFEVWREMATHRWSATARALGLSSRRAVSIERLAGFIPFPKTLSDLRTIAAVRRTSSR